MKMNENNMTDSEKLAMLLDGETDGIDTSEVLNALAENPELQQEFLDTMRMRQMMSGQLETPPDRLRRGVLAGIGLGGSGLWYYLQNTGFAAAGAFLASKVGVAVIAATLGVASTLFLMDNNDTAEISSTQTSTIKQYAELASAEPIEMTIPFVSSNKINTNESLVRSNSNFNNGANNIIRNSNAYSTSNQVVGNNDKSNTVAIRNSTDITESMLAYGNNSDNYINTTNNAELADNYRQLELSSNYDSGQNSGFIVNPSKRLQYEYSSDRALLFNLQVKGISNSSLTDANMSVVESPTINNIGIALMYSVNDDFELGLEFGQEFFVNKVNISTFDSDETMLENQLTFWGGLKANYTFSNLSIITEDLKPMTSLLVGGTNRGWVTKASAGLVYDVSNKLSMFAGPEWTTGIYHFNSNLLSTHKFGLIYGMSLRF